MGRRMRRHKNYEGGIHKLDDKRMYQTGNETWPVKMLKFFLSKTYPDASSYIFNKCGQNEISCPEDCNIWYTDKPIKSEHMLIYGNLQGRYSAHCLRGNCHLHKKCQCSFICISRNKSWQKWSIWRFMCNFRSRFAESIIRSLISSKFQLTF